MANVGGKDYERIEQESNVPQEVLEELSKIFENVFGGIASDADESEDNDHPCDESEESKDSMFIESHINGFERFIRKKMFNEAMSEMLNDSEYENVVKQMSFGIPVTEIEKMPLSAYLMDIKGEGLSLMGRKALAIGSEELKPATPIMAEFIEHARGVIPLFEIYAKNSSDAICNFGYLISRECSFSKATYIRQEFWNCMDDFRLKMFEETVNYNIFKFISDNDIKGMKESINVHRNLSPKISMIQIKELLERQLCEFDSENNRIVFPEGFDIHTDQANIFVETSAKDTRGLNCGIVFFDRDKFYFGIFDKESKKIKKGDAVKCVITLKDSVGNEYLYIPLEAINEHPFGVICLFDRFLMDRSKKPLYE